MGVPGTRDADPSVVVALLAPLMFGYMFGDVLQGLAVAVGGFVLRNRLPALRVLVPGGIVAIAFGFAFGSVFAREDLIPALWVRPLEQPLLVLGTALAFGAVVLTVGQLLNALQYFWRGEFLRWLATEAGTLFAYLGLVGTAFDARALWGLPIGLVWAIAGPALVTKQDRFGAVGQAVGEVAERMLQLGVNTVSFVRVGAFALAHAGLCTAVVGMAEAAGPGYWPVLLHRQCRDRRPRGAGRQHPDHATHPVRVLHPLPHRARPRVRAAAVAGAAFQTDLPEQAMKSSNRWMYAIVTVTVLTAVLATVALLLAVPALAAEGPAAAIDPGVLRWGFASAAASAGLAALGAGYAVAQVGTAALGALAEKPELFGRVLVMVGLAEGIAIYGLIVSILILNRLG